MGTLQALTITHFTTPCVFQKFRVTAIFKKFFLKDIWPSVNNTHAF